MKTLIIGSFILFTLLFMAQKNVYADKNYQKAVFAGGCFWCMEAAFQEQNGVIDVTSGYTGGEGKDPTYNDYYKKGHLEAIEVTYDPSKISYPDLLDVFWTQIDPTDEKGQFVDRGKHYSSAIFYNNDEQKNQAIESKKKLSESGRFSKPIVTPISPASRFYKAESYHQDYYIKNTSDYKRYRAGSGRDQFLDKTWGKDKNFSCPITSSGYKKPEDKKLKEALTPLQYEVTQKNATETPFNNEYWDNKKEGIYVDAVSGEVLFSSKDKFDSGTGWPSFTKPLKEENLIEKQDKSHSMTRVEVRSKNADSHLGHVFDDGPSPTGRRFCINSASLRFIPKEDLKKEGYGEYSKLF